MCPYATPVALIKVAMPEIAHYVCFDHARNSHVFCKDGCGFLAVFLKFQLKDLVRFKQ